MSETRARPAEHRDLEALAGLFETSLAREARRDPLLERGEGRWEPVLADLLKRPDAMLMVLDTEGGIEGYFLAFIQVFAGPRPHRSLARRIVDRLLGRPRPRPLVKPIRVGWVEEVMLSRRGRRAGGTVVLSRAVWEWARAQGIDRVAGLVSKGNTPAAAFARFFGLQPTREFYSIDVRGLESLPTPDN